VACTTGHSDLKEYNHPIIEITESGCGYLEDLMKQKTAAYPTAVIQWSRRLAELAGAIADGARGRLSCMGPFSTTSMAGVIPSAMVDLIRTLQPEAHDKRIRPLYGRVAAPIGSMCKAVVERANSKGLLPPNDLRSLYSRFVASLDRNASGRLVGERDFDPRRFVRN